METYIFKKIKKLIKDNIPELDSNEVKAITNALAELVDNGDKIPFDDFWAKYPKKHGSFKCKQIWRLMSGKQQYMAIANLPNYLAAVGRFVNTGENYLNKKLYLDYSTTPTTTAHTPDKYLTFEEMFGIKED